MRKFIFCLVSFALAASLIPALPANPSSLTLQDLSRMVRTPDEIAHFMWRNFRFENDRTQFGREEYWQSPEEMLASRKGDCEDFALFAHRLLKKNGIPSFLLNIYSDQKAHTVCVFKGTTGYNAIDGTDVARLDSRKLNQLIFEINPFWKKAAIVAPAAGHQAKILKELERVSPKP